MEGKTESERSYSEDSSSSSDSSSRSSDGDDDCMEPVRVLGTTLELPQELCEDYGIFKEFFSMKTWESLDDKHKEHLKTFLPKFQENQEEETEKTIKMLFDYEPFHFTSPLNDFFHNLKQGNYRPDIAKMRKFLLKARSKQQRHKVKSYYAKLLPEVLISRERLLAAAKSAPPGPAPRIPCLPPKPSSKNNFKPVYLRAKQRYFEELAAIRSEVGGAETDDDNYPEGPPEPSYKRRKLVIGPNGDSNISGTLGVSDQPHLSSMQCLKNVLMAHRTRRQYRENHPELNTIGITLEEIKQRVAIVNGAKKLMFGGQKVAAPVTKHKKGSKKDPNKLKVPDSKAVKKVKEESESVESRPLLPNIKIKCEQEESDSETSSFVDPVASSPRQSKKSIDSVEIKQEIIDNKYPNMNNCGYDPTLEIKQEPPDVMPVPGNSRMPVHQPVPIKLEDLDGIDMMALPVEIADDSGEVLQVETSADFLDDESVEVDESLTETTHSSFLSLVRALFPARDAHRATKQQLHARCAAVMRSPIAPLNTWYNLSDDWCADLDSALDFLAGERGSHPDDFVPYLQYMPETQVGSEETVKVYQWIGAGRDCDAILSRLCERWIRASSPHASSREPPPPKFPTSWTVRPPTNTDIYEFRVQERRRFATAAKPFTYVQHGYRAVVGPCARAWGASGGAGAALLAGERPRHATFAALVRDALARLPNGEGTRHDVLTLLKMSQFIAACSDQALLNAVTTVLERFSLAKRDPVVKHDQRTAIWTYLHRNKTEEDWLNKTAGRGRGGKAAALASLAPPASPPPAPTAARAPATNRDTRHSPPHAMDLEVSTVEEVIEASDSDVDVDDSGLPTSAPQLSSAQLLMQATQTQVKQPTPQRSRKQPMTSQKRSYTPKQNSQAKQTKAALMTQSVKQANLLAQSVKQATITAPNKALVQAVKNAISKQTIVVSTPKTITTPGKTTVQVAKQTTATKPTTKTAPKVSIKQPVPSPKPPQSPKQPLQSTKQPPHSPKQPPQSPKQSPQSPKHSPQSPMQPPHSPMQPPHSPMQPPHSPMQPPRSPMQPPRSPMQPPQSPMLPPQSPMLPPQSPIQPPQSPMQPPQSPMPPPQSPMQPPKPPPPSPKPLQPVKQPTPLPKPVSVPVSTVVKTVISQSVTLPGLTQTAITKSLPSVIATPHRSPLIKQRPLLKNDPNLVAVSKASPSVITQLPTTMNTVIQPIASTSILQSQAQNKILAQGTRSLLIRPPAIQTTVTAVNTPTAQASAGRRGVVRVLSPANTPSGKSLISPRALLQDTPVAKKRATAANAISATTMPQLQSLVTGTSVVNSVPAAVTSAVQTRTVQLAGGRTVQLANQTVHLPSGQSVQLSSGHTLQLSSLQLPTHSVRLPSGQTVQLATPQAMQALKNSTPAKIPSPRAQSTPIKTTQPIQVPISTVQLAGQTVQIGGQTVQLAGQSVQLTGHTVKLPSGQSVQVASQNILPSSVQLPSGQTVQLPSGQTVQLPSGQTVQLPSGQTVQLATGNVQTVQIGSNMQLAGQSVQLQTSGQNVQLGPQTVQLSSGQNVQLPQTVQIGGQTVQIASGQSVQLPSGQTIQLPSGQTVQLPSGQTVQLPSGQTVQLPSGQTVQLTSAQTLQLASGQTVQLANQTPKSLPQIVRSQAQVDKTATSQPIVAKLLTNAQGQMVSLESLSGSGRTLVSGIRPRPSVRVLSPATRLTRPLLLTSAKPLHNIILQQSDGTVRVPSSGGVNTSQTIVISNIASPTISTPTTAAPVLKLQQVNPIQQVKLAQGIKLQQPGANAGVATSSGVRSVLMDGQQLKLVSGRHVLARILRPAHPPNQ